MKMRSALVVGATGLVGLALVKLLCESEEYAAVNIIARRPLDFDHPKLVVKVREFDQIADADIEFAHEVFCCLGTPDPAGHHKAHGNQPQEIKCYYYVI